MTRRDEPVLDAELLAQAVEHVCAAGFLLLAASREAVGELAAVVGEQLDDLDGKGLLDFVEEVATAAIGLVGIELDEDPARSTVDGNEEIAPCRLVGHLRQVLDVHVQEAWFVVFEGLERGLGLSCIGQGLGLQLTQIANAMSAQAAVKPGALSTSVPSRSNATPRMFCNLSMANLC